MIIPAAQRQQQRALGESARTFREFIVDHGGIDSHGVHNIAFRRKKSPDPSPALERGVLPQYRVSHSVYNYEMVA